jgi:hypothetical protein
MFRPLLLVLVLLAVVLGVGVAACSESGSGETEATASTDAAQLLADTFANEDEVGSGRLDVALTAEGRGARQGPTSVRVSGPFVRREGRLPEFDLDLALDGAGQTLAAGATSTGEKGYVSFQGTDYVLPELMYRQLQAGYEQAYKDGRRPGELGLDPVRWVTDPANAGEARVGGEDTIKLTGGVDVPRMLDDVDALLGKAAALAPPGHGRMPSGLTERHKRHIARAVDRAGVEVYTGRQDRILRRLVVSLDARDPDDRGSGAKAVKLDVSLTGVGEDQQIEAPASARPFEELRSRLGTLGMRVPGGRPGGADRRLERYADCVRAAGSDRAKERACADLLTGP